MRRLSPLLLLGLIGCSGSAGPGDPVNIRAFLFSPVTGTSIPGTASATVVGRNSNEFESRQKSTSSVPNSIELDLIGVPNEESLIFQLSGAGFDTTATFPTRIQEGQPIELGIFPAGAIALFKTLATSGNNSVLAPSQIEPQHSTLVGTVSSGGNCQYDHVELVDPLTGNSAVTPTQSGPFYFDPSGNIVNTGRFADVQCNYIIFNVLPGHYKARFFLGATYTEADVIALGGQVMVGYNVP